MLDIGGSTGVVAAPFRARVRAQRHPDRSGAARGRAGARVSASRRSPAWSRSTTSATAASTSCIICQTVDHLLDVAGTLKRVRELLADVAPLHRHRRFPRRVSAELVGRGRDQDRPSVLPDAGHDDGVSAACRIRGRCAATTPPITCTSATCAVPAPRTRSMPTASSTDEAVGITSLSAAPGRQT